VPIPKPLTGEVLVKIECAPINPSDTYFMAGMYKLYTDDPAKIKFPLSPGWEGSGVVIQNGGGLMGWRLVGKRVAVCRHREANRVFSYGGCYQ
jgi:NADPH:quinone reductase-like Zn-dependent oxidoreductase